MKKTLKARGWTHAVFRLAAFAVIFVMLHTRTVAQDFPRQLGDLDGDGQVTVIDLQRLLNHINSVGASFNLLAVPLRGYADVTGDGYINQADVDMMAQAVLGTPITTSPRPLIAEPASGANEVGVTVRPRVYFPKPIIPSTLNSNNFYASFAGRKLPARIVPANDGTFAWLFLDPPMPGASQVQVTVDGSTISVVSGEILDADADLAPGGMFRFNFSTVSVAGIPNTVLSSRIVDPGPDLIPRTADDVVLAAGYQYLLPIAGVRVHVLGMENNFAYTDANGRFTLTNMPVGNVKVVLDGRTATNPPAGYYFPEMVMDTTFEPGITNGVMNIVDANGNVVRDPNGVPIRALAMYLPRVASNVLQSVSATNTTLITLQSNAAYNLPTNQQQYLTVEVQPGSLVGMDGRPLTNAQVGVSVVPPELVRDMLPPGLLQHTFDITVQAPGVGTFSTPAPMTFPNVFNAPPGTKLNFLSFDHTTGRLVIEGTATVSEDGLFVRTDPGTGITHPGWHGLTPPGDFVGPPLPPPPPPSCGAAFGPGNCDGIYLKCIDDAVSAFLDQFQECTENDGRAGDTAVCFINAIALENFLKRRCQKAYDKCKMEECRKPAMPSANTADPAYQQLVDFASQITALAEPYYYARTTLPTNVQAQLIALMASANAIADGNAVGYMRQRLLAAELQFVSTAEGQIERHGNAPAYPINYVAVLDGPSGTFEIRGQTESYGQYGIFVGATETIRCVIFFDPWANTYGVEFPNLRQSPSHRMQRVVLVAVDDNLFDTDTDGVPDVLEQVYGSSPSKYDSDGDGIGDLAEIQQGLDPLGGRPFATGIIASLPLAGEAKEVVLEGSILDNQQQTAYLALGSRGLGIVNASQFRMPILLGQLDLPGDATDVAVDSNLRIAAVAGNVGGLHLVNASNPAQPILLQTIPGSVTQVEVVSGVVYAAFGGTLNTFDLATGQLLENLNLGGSDIVGMAHEGSFLYTLDSSQTLRVVDISGSSGPDMVLRGSRVVPASGGKLFVGNGIAYIGAGQGFATASVLDPDNPVVLSGVDALNIAGQAVVPNGSGLAVSVASLAGLGNVFHVLSVSDPSDTAAFITQFTLPANPFSLAIGAGIAFVADGSAGLQVVNYRSFDNQGVPPVLSITAPVDRDINAPGIQVEEGSLLTIGAQVSDDVQVRNVELLLDGQVVRNDVSFPWDLTVRAPLRAASRTTALLQVRATDTGGNGATSSIVTVEIIEDRTAPRVRRVLPERNGIVTTNADTLFAVFNEAISPPTVNEDTFRLFYAGPDNRLGSADDVALGGGNVTYRESFNAAVLRFAQPLAFGSYRAVVDSNITDSSGNRMQGDFSWPFYVIRGSANDDDDGDGLSNADEAKHGSNPFLTDTDGDGWTDNQEVEDGANPGDASSRPSLVYVAKPSTYVMIPITGGTGLGNTIVARPPVELFLPLASGSSAGGIVVARPPVEITIPASSGTQLGRVVVAAPLVEIQLPTTNGGGVNGTTIARPPVIIQRQP